MNIKKTLTLLCICVLAYVSNAQIQTEINASVQNRGVIGATPLASAFGIYGQVPVSHYTGTPEIKIPLHAISYKDLSIDMSLMYHQAIGNKPDLFPGYFGNGWIVTLGGVITRISKATRPYERGNLATPIELNYNPTAKVDWSTNATLTKYLTNKTDFYDPNGTRYDEFTYNFGPFSGKFCTDHTDTQRIRTAQGEEFKIQIETKQIEKFIMHSEPQGPLLYLQGWGVYDSTFSLPDFPYKFIFTDSKGIKYTFGGVNDAIDLVRPGYTSQQNNNDNVLGVSYNILPSSWYLVSIESPNGYSIRLTYKRDKFYITSETSHAGKWININNLSGYFSPPPTALVVKSTMFNPCYIDKIITPIDSTKFYWSEADLQLGYTFTPPNPPRNNVPPDISIPLHHAYYFHRYPDVHYTYINNRFPNKLDSFTSFTTTGNKIKTVEFGYTNNITTRLKLLNVKIKGKTSETTGIAEYKFQYNSLPLPPYLSLKVDKYGFYNGRNFLAYIPVDFQKDGNPTPYWDLFFVNPSTVQRNAYVLSREPDTNFTKAEILEKVTYPTGGYTTYEYENNRFGRYVDSWPAAIVENPAGADSLIGGLRIKKLCSYNYLNDKVLEKNYYYRKNYAAGGTGSSGVLNYKPRFYQSFEGTTNHPLSMPGGVPTTGILKYHEWGTNPINQQNINEPNFINYSEVAEVNTDGGYTVFKYKNHDNGYLDKPSVNFASDNINVGGFWKDDDENSLALERGQVLSQTVYNNANERKLSVENEYNDDPARFDKNIRVVKMLPNPLFSADYTSIRCDAYFYYRYYPFLKKKTTKQFEGTDSITTVATYNYDTYYRLLKYQTTTNGVGKTDTSTYSYPHNYIGIPVYDSLLKRHSVSPVVETNFLRDTVAAAKLVNNFQIWTIGTKKLFLPVSTQAKILSGPLETRHQINKYDSIGNLLEQQKIEDVKEVYLWGYKGQYPVAKITGSDYATVSIIINQTVLSNPATTDAAMRKELNKLRSATALAKAFIITYTYAPLIGITSETDANGRIIFYQYDNFNRLVLIRDEDYNILKKICYNYNGQTEDCNIYGNIYGNVPKSQSFVKPCLFCTAAPPVTYTVPAGVYFSTTQGGADSLAQAEINASGQAYANQYDSCSAIPANNVNRHSSAFGNISIKNTVTNIIYNYTITPGFGTLGQVPCGTYNVTITVQNPSPQRTYYLNINGFSQQINTGIFPPSNIKANFYSISITSPSLVYIL